MIVAWPGRGPRDARVSVLRSVAANHRFTGGEAEAVPAPALGLTNGLVADVTRDVAIPCVHRENDLSDFEREPLMPKLVSTEGPALAVADVNGDGLDDMFFGGAKGQPGKLLIQQRNGSFTSVSEKEFAKDSLLRTSARCSSTQTETAIPTSMSSAVETNTAR